MTPTLRFALLSSACCFAVAASPARAQDATTSAAGAVPAITCVSPGPIPADQRSPDRAKFQDRVTEYETCVNTYAKAQGAKASEYAALSRASSAAANKAIDEFNAYVATLNAKLESEKAAAAPTKK